jgi:hypothetical protein
MKWSADFKKAFAYDWPLYVILPVVAGLSLSYILAVVHQPKSYEKLNVFVASAKIESSAFCKDIEEKFQDNGLKEVTAVQSNPNDALFAQKLNVVGYEGQRSFPAPRKRLEKHHAFRYHGALLMQIWKRTTLRRTPVRSITLSDGDSYGVRDQREIGKSLALFLH